MPNLYALAAADTKAILEDSASGFGVPMTLTAPNGDTQEITGMAADIGNTIDPETGQNIAQRTAHVTLPTASLTIGRPQGVPDKASLPWRVTFQLPGETTPQTFKIFETMPDRVGCMVCFIEKWGESVAPSPLPIDIDFRTLATQNLGSGTGTVELDGYTFRYYQAAAADQARIENGTGLIIRSDASQAYQLGLRLSDNDLNEADYPNRRIRTLYTRNGVQGAFSTLGTGLGNVNAAASFIDSMCYMGFTNAAPAHVFAKVQNYLELGNTALQNSGTHIVTQTGGITGECRGYWEAGLMDPPSNLVGSWNSPSFVPAEFGWSFFANNIAGSELTIERIRIEEFTP